MYNYTYSKYHGRLKKSAVIIKSWKRGKGGGATLSLEYEAYTGGRPE